MQISEQLEQDITQLVQNTKNALIGSVDADGFSNIKAMLPPRKREGVQIIYFSTNTSSERVKQFQINPKACVYFYDSVTFQGVMLKGRMAVSQSPEYKEMLWRQGDTLYYPLGVTDPDYCVLIFRTESISYYSDMETKVFTVTSAY